MTRKIDEGSSNWTFSFLDQYTDINLNIPCFVNDKNLLTIVDESINILTNDQVSIHELIDNSTSNFSKLSTTIDKLLDENDANITPAFTNWINYPALKDFLFFDMDIYNILCEYIYIFQLISHRLSQDNNIDNNYLNLSNYDPSLLYLLSKSFENPMDVIIDIANPVINQLDPIKYPYRFHNVNMQAITTDNLISRYSMYKDVQYMMKELCILAVGYHQFAEHTLMIDKTVLRALERAKLLHDNKDSYNIDISDISYNNAKEEIRRIQYNIPLLFDCRNIIRSIAYIYPETFRLEHEDANDLVEICFSIIVPILRLWESSHVDYKSRSIFSCVDIHKNLLNVSSRSRNEFFFQYISKFNISRIVPYKLSSTYIKMNTFFNNCFCYILFNKYIDNKNLNKSDNNIINIKRKLLLSLLGYTEYNIDISTYEDFNTYIGNINQESYLTQHLSFMLDTYNHHDDLYNIIFEKSSSRMLKFQDEYIPFISIGDILYDAPNSFI